MGYRKEDKAIPIDLLPLKATLKFPKKDEFSLVED